MNAITHLTADDSGILMNCPQCHSTNRIPFPRLHQRANCGTCKTALPQSSLPVDIETTTSFAALIRAASLPVLVDFWAPWCGPCQMVAPEVAKLATLAAGELVVVKLNTEAQPGIASSMNIRSIPTFVVFTKGRETGRTSGGMSAPQLRAFALRAAGQAEAN